MRRTFLRSVPVADGGGGVAASNKAKLTSQQLGALRGATGMTMRRGHKYLGARGGAKNDELPKKARRYSDTQRERFNERKREAVATMLPDAIRDSHRLADPRDVRLAELTDRLFAQGVQHVGTATNIQWLPMGNPAVPEVAFAGRSNCGSTRLLRALFKDHAAVSPATKLGAKDGVNYWEVGGAFRVAETPGFGSSVCPWSVVVAHLTLIRNFVQARPNLKMLYYLMDCSPDNGATFRDIDALRYLTREVKNVTIVLTKADRYGVRRAMRELLEHGIEHPALACSAATLGGVDTLRFDMVSNATHSLPLPMLKPREVQKLGERLLSRDEMLALEYPDGDSRNLPGARLTVGPHPLAGAVAEWRARYGHAGEGDSDGPQFLPDLLQPPKPLPSASGVSGAEGAAAGTEGQGLDADAVTSAAEVEEAAEEEAALRKLDAAEDAVPDTPAPHPGADAVDAAGLPEASEAELEEILRGALDGDDEPAGASTGPTDIVQVAEPPRNGAAPTPPQPAALSEGERLAQLVRMRDPSQTLPSVLRKPQLLRYVAETSPWRNSLLWPGHVLPTANARVNVVVCPDDPQNPFLVQSRFAAPRGDMLFRRHALGRSADAPRCPSSKGMYLRETRHNGSLLVIAEKSGFAQPYFPQISEVDIAPLPQAVAGGYSKYHLSFARRAEALEAHATLRNDAGATSTFLNPLLAAPGGTQNPALNAEVSRLELAAAGQDDPVKAALGYGGSLAERLRRLPPPGSAAPALPSSQSGAAPVGADGTVYRGGGQLLAAALGDTAASAVQLQRGPAGDDEGAMPLGDPFASHSAPA